MPGPGRVRAHLYNEILMLGVFENRETEVQSMGWENF